MRRETVIILLLMAVVIVPMWYVALTSGTGGSGIALGKGTEHVPVNTSASIAPTARLVSSPVEVSVNQSGVIVWWALFGLVGALVFARRFIERVGRSGTAIAPGTGPEFSVPEYLVAEGRWVLEYWPAPNSRAGLVVIAVLGWSTVAFAGLLFIEGTGYARTQYLGLYAGMLFLSLALTVTAYAAYFVPDITIAEHRGEH
ncbi:MAG: hypothetical protein ABEI96_10125 [Haloarculaceae archaeon]